MKMITKSVLIAGVAGLAVTTMFARSPSSQGTEIIHYSVRVALTNTAADTNTPDASGTVQATEAIQGTADKETLNLTAKGLSPSSGYSIAASTSGGSTNLGPVTTDSKGGLKATFSTNGKSKKNLGPPPTPLTTLTDVEIANSNTVNVLAADLSAPSTLQYLVKKNVPNTNGVSASVTVSANTRSAKFSMNASGLNAGADYVLLFNGTAVQTNAATSRGTLKINSPLTSTNSVIVNPLQLQSVGLNDTNGVSVFNTTVP